MPGRKLVLSKTDELVLGCFFAQPNYQDSGYLELIRRWVSTNEVSIKLEESHKRTKNRLFRLKEFGLLELTSLKKGALEYNYWYISNAGIYYKISKLTRQKLQKFLQTNNKIREFNLIQKSLTDSVKEAGVDYLFNQIKNCIKQKNYHEISRVVYAWLKNSFGNYFVRMPITPAFVIS